MKKITLLFALFLSLTFSSKAQVTSCGNFCVLDMTIDTSVTGNHKLHVSIYNGNDTSTYLNYPIVMVTNSTGDTVANKSGLFYIFAQRGGDTVIHVIPTTLANLPVGFAGNVYLTDGITDSTCSYSYPMACTVGIHEITSSNSLSIYPNPANGDIHLHVGEMNSKQGQINVFDITGNLVRKYSITRNDLTINRDGLNNGIYFIIADINGVRLTKKLILE